MTPTTDPTSVPLMLAGLVITAVIVGGFTLDRAIWLGLRAFRRWRRRETPWQ